MDGTLGTDLPPAIMAADTTGATPIALASVRLSVTTVATADVMIVRATSLAMTIPDVPVTLTAIALPAVTVILLGVVATPPVRSRIRLAVTANRRVVTVKTALLPRLRPSWPCPGMCDRSEKKSVIPVSPWPYENCAPVAWSRQGTFGRPLSHGGGSI